MSAKASVRCPLNFRPPLLRRTGGLRQAVRLTANEGQPIDGCRWCGSGPPRALLQIAHDLGDHALLYRLLAEALAARGWAVLAHHHCGHGPRARALETQGDLGARGFAGPVSDLSKVSGYGQTLHPGLPLMLLGHSMGSFAVQRCLPVHGHRLGGAVLSGSAAVDLMQQAVAARGLGLRPCHHRGGKHRVQRCRAVDKTPRQAVDVPGLVAQRRHWVAGPGISGRGHSDCGRSEGQSPALMPPTG